MTQRLSGVITPLLTPYEEDCSIALDLFCAHAAQCLQDGSHYLSPFGTTSEAPSHSSRERRLAVEMLLRNESARPDQLMPGTGLCSLEETAELCRHAADLGCAGVMVLPPFFLKPLSDEGLYRYFSSLIYSLGPTPPAICLYNIPQNSGVPISPGLAAQLNTAFPEICLAYKDSSGDWNNTRAVIEAAPGLSVFPGSETVMPDALALGGAGCISASCNSNTRQIRRLYDALLAVRTSEIEFLMPQIAAHREALREAGLIGGLKSLKAYQTGDARWLNLRAPMLNADPTLGPHLAKGLTEQSTSLS